MHIKCSHWSAQDNSDGSQRTLTILPHYNLSHSKEGLDISNSNIAMETMSTEPTVSLLVRDVPFDICEVWRRKME